MSTDLDKLGRQFNAWWAAEGFRLIPCYCEDYEKRRADVKYGWMAAMKTKEQG
jgi:hypothetical protein